MKNKSSYASLPLIDVARELLLKEKDRQNKNKQLYGNTYKNKDNYICVKDDGELMKPDTVTDQVPNFIESVGLRRISLHSLRHSCRFYSASKWCTYERNSGLVTPQLLSYNC